MICTHLKEKQFIEHLQFKQKQTNLKLFDETHSYLTRKQNKNYFIPRVNTNTIAKCIDSYIYVRPKVWNQILLNVKNMK